MAVEKVRHVGDLVACVAAIDEATAMEALNLFEIEWEVLEPIFDPKKGLEDTDEPIHWRGKYHLSKTNVQKRVFQEFGDRSFGRKTACRISWKMDYGRRSSWIY